MRRVLMVLAMAVSMALLACGVAVADTVTTDFEAFTLGSVNGQDGWHSAAPGDIPALPNGYDQEVVGVSGIPGFGTQSLRHSNAFNEPTGEFFFQTYSKPTAESAGENQPNTEYVGEFSFTSTNQAAQQPGLFMTISPDNSTGGRMSAVRLIDEADGIRAIIFDTPDPTTGAFASYDAGLYSRDAVHTVRFWIKFVPGENNDRVRIFIDGRDIGRELGVCFTTWENFYRAVQQVAVPVTNSLEFRAAGGEVPSLVGGGFLFDNVTTTTANGAGPAACPDAPVVPPVTPPQITPPAVAPPTVAPAQQMVPVKLRRAVAALRGPSKCVVGTYAVVVTGAPVTRVAFRVDGKRVRTLRARKGQRRFRVLLRATKRRSVVTARVQFAGDATPRAKTLRRAIRRCGRIAVKPKPRFTG